jgi:hypothetical protein
MNMLTLAAEQGLIITKHFVPNHTAGNAVEYMVWGSNPDRPLFRTVNHKALMAWLIIRADS